MKAFTIITRGHEKCCKQETNGRYRDWCCTLNNYTDIDLKDFYDGEILNRKSQKTTIGETLKYMVVAKEVGANGTPHLQMYLSFKNPKGLPAMIKIMGPRAHCCCRRGTHEQASDYCKKGDQPKDEWGTFSSNGPNFGLKADFREYGECPQDLGQGARSDLVKIKDLIVNKAITVDQIALDDPMLFHQYGRTLRAIEEISLREQWRTEKTECVWYCGPTGTGKSEKLFNEEGNAYNPDKFYVKDLSDKGLGWWDGYKGQHTVLFDEFRGQISFDFLLRLTDKWAMTVSYRNRESVPFVSKRILISSCFQPHEIYKKTAQQADSINQLLRRIKIIKMSNQAETIKTLNNKNDTKVDNTEVIEGVITEYYYV